MVNLKVNEVKNDRIATSSKISCFTKQLIAQLAPDFRLNVILGQQDF